MSAESTMTDRLAYDVLHKTMARQRVTVYDLYGLLGVSPNVDEDGLRAAYDSIAQKLQQVPSDVVSTRSPIALSLQSLDTTTNTCSQQVNPDQRRLLGPCQPLQARPVRPRPSRVPVQTVQRPRGLSPDHEHPPGQHQGPRRPDPGLHRHPRRARQGPHRGQEEEDQPPHRDHPQRAGRVQRDLWPPAPGLGHQRQPRPAHGGQRPLRGRRLRRGGPAHARGRARQDRREALAQGP